MRERARGRQAESGVVLVLVALFLFVVLALLALSVGLGFVQTQSQRLQTVANLGAITALDFYVNNPRRDGYSEQDRRNEAVERVNDFMRLNRLKGAELQLAGLGLAGDDGGQIVFGRYFRNPAGIGGDCGSDPTDYPCFLELPDSVNESANAVLLRVQNQRGGQNRNPIIAPFTSMLGQREFFLQSSTATVLLNSCVGHLLDVSVSSAGATHQTISLQQRLCSRGFECPEFPARPPLSPAFTAESNCDRDDEFPLCASFEPHLGVSFTPPPNTLISGFDLVELGSDEALDFRRYSPVSAFAFDEAFIDERTAPDIWMWENLPDSRSDFVVEFGEPSARVKFKSDYIRTPVNGAINNPQLPTEMLINLNPNLRPRPLREFMLAANTALRLLEAMPAEANRSFFWAFTGDVEQRKFPPPDNNGEDQLSSQLGFMTQITNMDNPSAPGYIGTSGTEFNLSTGAGDWAIEGTRPNMLDFGFFPMRNSPPLPSVSPDLVGVNHSRVLFEAANLLSRECGRDGRRMIFLYTDMVPTCDFVPELQPPASTEILRGIFRGENTGSSCQLDAFPTGGTQGSILSPFLNYFISEIFILSDLVPFLREQGVSVTVFLDGPNIRSAVRNVLNPELDPGEQEACRSGQNQDPDCYLSFGELARSGRRGLVPAFSQGGYNTGFGRCGELNGETTFDCSGIGSNSFFERFDLDDFLRRSNGDPEAIFDRAAPLAYDLATQTGGLYCPLLDVPRVEGAPDPRNYVDFFGDCPTNIPEAVCCRAVYEREAGFESVRPCVFDNSLRDPTNSDSIFLEFPVFFVDKAQQAADCARDAITANPYIQEVPLTTCRGVGGGGCCPATEGCLFD